MTVEGSVVKSGAGIFYVGNQGGTGTLNVASGGVFDIQANALYVAGNNGGGTRTSDTRGFVNIAGTLITGLLELTPFFPNTGTDAYVDAGVVWLLPDGVLETPRIKKNDRAYSYFHFAGGALKITARGLLNDVGNGGHLYYIIEDDCEAIIDTAGNDVTFNPAASGAVATLTGNGGLRKQGAGSLTFQLAEVDNTFTGDIVVEEGTLCLNRPLAPNQQVTVFNGATFVFSALSDTGQVHVATGGQMLFTVAGDVENLDLTAMPQYYANRLGGPPAGSATLAGTLVYDSVNSGIPSNPFRLIGQGGTLVLTNTGLDTAYLWLGDSGRFTFWGDRTNTLANAGSLRLAGSIIYRQEEGNFILKGALGNPVEFSLAAPNQLEVAGRIVVGDGADAVFNTTDATINFRGLRVAGGDGVQASFIQRGGSVLPSGESWLGYDNGTGRLDVANGTFSVAGDLRIAIGQGDPGNMRPDGTLIVSNGVVQCNTLNFTPWWIGSDAIFTNRDVGRVHILDGGIVQVNLLNKNDNCTSTINFEGGIVRARESQANFVMIGQSLATLVWTAPSGQFITIDSQGHAITIPNSGGNMNGRLIVTGDGGFRKRGTGRLDFFAARSDYLGDTVVEAGTLRLNGNNLIPSGVGYGDLVLTANGSRLDLAGRNASVNKISGLGFVMNSSAVPSTLNILANGEDDLWARSYVSAGAPVNLVKQGGGTLTLREADTITATAFTIQDGTVRLIESLGGYPFYRFKIEAVKTPSTANSMQFSQIALYNGAENVVPNRIGILYDSTATGDGGTFPNGERPEMCINGFVPFDHLVGPPGGTLTNNKWLDFRAAHNRLPVDRERVWLRFQFADSQPLTAYNWATANDTENRDPADWRLQGSRDGDNWTDLDVKTGFNATGFRNTWVTENGFPLQITEEIPVISANTVVVIGQDGTLEATGGLPQPIGTLAGTGSLVLDGTDIILGGATTPGAFYGTISGDGNVIVQGDNQSLNALNTATGDFIVRSGTTTLTAPEAIHRWFRFTIQDTRAYTNATQLSEFALYAADGSRCNLGLTQGAGATTLNPGQFWTPAYQLGNPNTETAASLFDNLTGTKWCLSNNHMDAEDPATWRAVTMRLADGIQEVMSYNLATANDFNERDPITWMLESSADGLVWQLVDARTDFIPTTGRQAWYNNSIPFGLLLNRALSDTGGTTPGATIPDDAIVEVAPGATLAIIGGTEVIGALRVDMATGAGTITRFTPAANGTLHLTNATGAPTTWVIPITFGSVDTPSNLSKWQIIADGIPINGYRLVYNPSAGTLTLKPQGTTLMVR